MKNKIIDQDNFLNKTINNIDLSGKIMAEIKNNNIKMKPRIYFILEKWLLKLLLLLILAIAAFFINISLFKLRIYDPIGFALLGIIGIRGFIGSIPWIMISVSIVSTTILIKLLSRYDFYYKKNFAVATLGVVIFLLTGGFLIDSTGLNENAKKSGNYPLLYKGIYLSDSWVMGEVEIVDKNKKEMIVETPHRETIKVVWSDSTFMPSGNNFEHGTYVQVSGNKQKSTFHAEGIIIRESQYKY